MTTSLGAGGGESPRHLQPPGSLPRACPRLHRTGGTCFPALNLPRSPGRIPRAQQGSSHLREASDINRRSQHQARHAPLPRLGVERAGPGPHKLRGRDGGLRAHGVVPGAPAPRWPGLGHVAFPRSQSPESSVWFRRMSGSPHTSSAPRHHQPQMPRT